MRLFPLDQCRPVIAATLLLLLPACGNGSLPGFEPQVINNPDDFSFQATGVDGISQTLEYTWQNSGTLANVTQSSSVSTPAGSAALVLLGPGDSLTYGHTLIDVGTFTSAASTAGAWTIRVILTDVRGTLNFRVQKGG
jgi:hypothetical protein